jgi:seryl-tRNA synthetase
MERKTLVHTLNGSSLAIGRTKVAIMENFKRSMEVLLYLRL